MQQSDLNWASLPPSGDLMLAEWLEGAACDPHVKALAVRAVYAASQGVDPASWRRDLLREHPAAPALIAQAEECMRSAGLWPWARMSAGTRVDP